MPTVGLPRIFNSKFSFYVHIDGFSWAGFSKCSALKQSNAEIKHYEGATLIPHKFAGRTDFAPITLERGAVTEDLDMYLWASQVTAGPANLGVKEIAYKRNVDLVQVDRDGEVLKRYTIFQAWPTEFEAGDWDNTTDEAVIEKMILTYNYFVRTA